MRRIALFLCAAVLAFATQPDFSVALMPDIQNLTTPQKLAIFQWVLDNKTTCTSPGCPTSGQWNTQAVWSLGDNTNTAGSGTQLTDSKAGWDLIKAAGLPFVIVPGNHDYDNGGTGSEILSRLLTQYDAVFGPSYYSGLSWYVADGYPSSSVTDNYYTLPTIGGYSFLVMGLEFYPRTAAVAWAHAVLQAHATLPQVILTHAYLRSCTGTGHVLDADTWGPDTYGVGGAASSNGQELFDNLVTLNNVSLIANGHFVVGGSCPSNNDPQADQTSVKADGHSVVEIFSNYQNDAPGYVTMLKFRPSISKIEVYNYNTVSHVFDTNNATHQIDWTPPDRVTSTTFNGAVRTNGGAR